MIHVTLRLALVLCVSAGVLASASVGNLTAIATAQSNKEERRAYALLMAIGAAGKATLEALRPVERCTVKGHRECLPAAARQLARVAAAQQPPVRRATEVQSKRSCARAGAEYLKGLRVLRTAAQALERAKTRRALRRAGRLIATSDRYQTRGFDRARKCWESTLK